MKKALLLALLLMMTIASATAQQKIQGTLIDRDSKEPVPMVTVQLLKAGSAFVSGTVSNDSGKFVIQTPSPGKYLLKISSIGYVTAIKRLQMEAEHDLILGNIIIHSDAVMLKEAQVTAQALKVTPVLLCI